jgi:hypothetical protein
MSTIPSIEIGNNNSDNIHQFLKMEIFNQSLITTFKLRGKQQKIPRSFVAFYV